MNTKATIYGKGPSLWSHDFSRDEGRVVLAINDAGYIVPRCDYIFMHDPILAAKSILSKTLLKSPKCTAVLPSCSREKGVGFREIIPESILPHVLWYEKDWTLCPNIQPCTEITHLWAGHCTAHSAMHYAFLIGVRDIRLVGFDGIANDELYGKQYPDIVPYISEERKKDPNSEKHATEHYTRYARMLRGMADLLGMTISQ